MHRKERKGRLERDDNKNENRERYSWKAKRINKKLDERDRDIDKSGEEENGKMLFLI